MAMHCYIADMFMPPLYLKVILCDNHSDKLWCGVELIDVTNMNNDFNMIKLDKKLEENGTPDFWDIFNFPFTFYVVIVCF